MAREIYPGVFVPDHIQTEQFSNSRAHKFLSAYSDVRYQNWQTALTIAEASYSQSMDNYRAQLKALKDVEQSASRSLAAMDNEIRNLKNSVTATDEKQVQQAANAQSAADRFNAGQTNAMKRAQYFAITAAGRTVYNKNNNELAAPQNVIDAATGARQAGDAGARAASFENSSAIVGQPPATQSANRYAAARHIYGDLNLTDPAEEQRAIAQIENAPGLSAIQRGNQINMLRTEATRQRGGGDLQVPGAPGSTGVKARVPTYEEQQAVKMRRLYELGGFQAVSAILPPDITEEQFLKDFNLEKTEGLRAKSQAQKDAALREQFTTQGPAQNIVEEARRIYSDSFEQNPYAKRREALAQAAGSLVNEYKANGMTHEAARDKAFNDLINFQADTMAAATEARKNEASSGGRAIARIPPTSIVDVDPTIVQNQATVPAPVSTSVDNSAFFGNAPDLGPSLRDELEQLLAARAARPPQAEAAPVAPAPVDPRMPNGRSAYAPGVGGLPAPSSYDYRGAGQVVQSAPTQSDLENDARVTNRGATPSMTARGQAPAFPVAPPQTVQPASSVAPRPLAPKTGSPLLPMARGESAAGSISTTGTQPAAQTGSISMTVERALELGNPFIVHSVGEGPRLSYIYDPGTKSFTLESKDGLPQDQPPIKEGDPRWNELMNPDLYEARPMPPATVPAAPPAGPPRAGGGSPRQPSVKQPPAVNSEEQRLMELLVTGTELADRPMKLNRLLNNTPAGKLVTQLMAANKKARTSQTFLDLREEIYRAYKGKPQQIELAIELLAASFIRETKSAAEKAQTTETN